MVLRIVSSFSNILFIISGKGLYELILCNLYQVSNFSSLCFSFPFCFFYSEVLGLVISSLDYWQLARESFRSYSLILIYLKSLPPLADFSNYFCHFCILGVFLLIKLLQIIFSRDIIIKVIYFAYLLQLLKSDVGVNQRLCFICTLGPWILSLYSLVSLINPFLYLETSFITSILSPVWLLPSRLNRLTPRNTWCRIMNDFSFYRFIFPLLYLPLSTFISSLFLYHQPFHSWNYYYLSSSFTYFTNYLVFIIV